MLNNVIKEIRNIIGKEQKISVNIWGNEIWFYIYETEVPITIRDKHVFLDTELYENKFDSCMLDELSRIMKLLEENIKEIRELLC